MNPYSMHHFTRTYSQSHTLQRYRFFLSTVLVAFCLFLTPSRAIAKDIVLQDIRTGGDTTKTRIVLEFSKPIEYNVFTLSAPNRLVIDTSDFTSTLSPQITVVKNNIVSTVRYGTFRPNVGRSVMDLRFAARIDKVFILNGDTSRLVIDLKRVSDGAMSREKYFSANWDAVNKKSIQQRDREIATLSRRSKQKKTKPLVVIDAGHGGPDPGSIGVGNVYEKHVTLSLAKIEAQKLHASNRFSVALTRSKDEYIPLRTRYKIAEKRQADFFISIHADSHKRSSVRGMSVYTLSEKSSDREAERLARKENQFDILVGESAPEENDILNILIDITQSNTMSASALFAKTLVKMARKTHIKTLRHPHRFAGFAVLKSPKIPSVLIEAGYMSNRTDIRNLRSKRWRQDFAETIYKSLVKYFKDNPIQ